MTRAVITGVGCVSGAGAGMAPLQDALSRGEPLGSVERIAGARGRVREIRVARIPAFDRTAFIPARKLRRMGDVSQVWVIACLLARIDARLETATAESVAGPERRGTFVGTGYGCIDTTWDYLRGLHLEGAGVANPFLFSESVANAPAGHSAIALDTRGASVTFTCADASAAAALEFASRAIRLGRVDIAYCGGIELMSEPLLVALSSLGAIEATGEGAVCVILESERHARQRGARIYAEVAGSGMAADPSASPTAWGTDPEPAACAIRRAMVHSKIDGAMPSPGMRVFLHPCGDPRAEEAQRQAAAAVIGLVELRRPGAVVGSLAAAGGFGIALAAVDDRTQDAMVISTGWGGAIYALLLRPFSDPPGPRV